VEEMNEPTIDEQIAYQREPWGSGEHEAAILASLKELAAIKSQQTEPVAWCNEKYNALFFDQPGIRESAAYENGELTPLYTAPQSGVREVNTDTVSVPREPTKQMLDAGGNAHWEADKNGNMLRTEAAHRIYNAMLRAAQEGKK
jgi:hypothetical protein